MKMVKSVLLSATVFAGVAVASTANAQVLLPAPGPNDNDAALHGAGATSIQNVLVQEFNCIGKDFQLGNSNNSFTTVPAALFKPTSPTAANPTLYCTGYTPVPNPLPANTLLEDIQPNFAAKYVGTGSGFGRQAWRLFSQQFDPVTAGVFNPFVNISGQTPWSHLQFAFADSNISQSDYNPYQANAQTPAGAAVVFPKYVLPVAIAYNPVYGINANGAEMRFNVAKPQSINGVVSGGLPLSRVAYCGIFNGTIKNWNDGVFKTANLNKTLQDTTNDTATRFNTDGVPIRLVGRLDRSGTTDVFSRHLAAVCGPTVANGGTNAYVTNAESLPYSPASGVNLANIRADTGYSTGNNNGGNYPNASNSTKNLISGDYFNTTTGAITYNGAGPSSSPVGNMGSGLFITANGSGALARAINLAPDYVLSTANGSATLNGKVGYIGADFVVNSASAPTASNQKVFAAALQVNGTGTLYAMPTAANGGLAFGSGTTAILPPQSNSTGAFTGTDTRTVPLWAASGTGVATRDNPLAWTAVLYADPTKTLAAPVKGYPITGTTQFLGYTCYLPTNRLNVVEFLGLNLGKINKDSGNRAISTNTFKGTGATLLGILAQSNIGVVPAAWQGAITETFLKKSTQKATVNGASIALATYGNGGNGLWIQSKYLLTAADIDATPKPTDVQPNPSCTGKTGA